MEESSDKTSAEALPKDRSLCGRMRDTLWDPFHFQRKEIRSENPEKNPEKTLQDQRGRRENLERITREYETQLRMNRSIQAGLLSKTEGLDKCAFSAVQVL